MADLIPIMAIACIFIGLPWLILHYVTQWKKGANLTREDENLLDELYDMARHLEDRVETIERIMTADNPDWKHRS
ncbi:MAG TPA: envelope stress response membrane protein PspB [Chakrabartia sp.]|nr:envelope stress response membrane protein PspB [Chakrabartia sp.]